MAGWAVSLLARHRDAQALLGRDEVVGVFCVLAEIDLRGLTGATVLAITRDGESVMIPTAREVLRAGDLLAVAGTEASISAAAALLRGEDPDGG